jgi:hypothetical protein
MSVDLTLTRRVTHGSDDGAGWWWNGATALILAGAA